MKVLDIIYNEKDEVEMVKLRFWFLVIPMSCWFCKDSEGYWIVDSTGRRTPWFVPDNVDTYNRGLSYTISKAIDAYARVERRKQLIQERDSTSGQSDGSLSLVDDLIRKQQ